MIHFKNLKHSHDGFSFIEVIVAILMLGIMMMAILTLQNTTFSGLTSLALRVQKTFALKNRLLDASKVRAQKKEAENKKPVDAKSEADTVRYAAEKISEKSSLKKFKNSFREMVSVKWQDGNKQQQETMVTYFYKAPEKKEKK